MILFTRFVPLRFQDHFTTLERAADQRHVLIEFYESDQAHLGYTASSYLIEHSGEPAILTGRGSGHQDKGQLMPK
jgi:hypothetical protein